MTTRREKERAFRKMSAEKQREERLQREAEEALMLAQYLRRKRMERELVERREAKRLRDYLNKRELGE